MHDTVCDPYAQTIDIPLLPSSLIMPPFWPGITFNDTEFSRFINVRSRSHAANWLNLQMMFAACHITPIGSLPNHQHELRQLLRYSSKHFGQLIEDIAPDWRLAHNNRIYNLFLVSKLWPYIAHAIEKKSRWIRPFLEIPEPENWLLPEEIHERKTSQAPEAGNVIPIEQPTAQSDLPLDGSKFVPSSRRMAPMEPVDRNNYDGSDLGKEC